jgi:cation-transporting P-type ATPase E
MAQDTGPDGLTERQAAERRAAGQVNVVPARSSRSIGAILRANVLTWFNGLIGTLFVIMLVAGPIQDALFGFVIIANALIGIIQETRAKRTLDSLAIIGEARPTVRRDGADRQIAASEIVLGDLILLDAGDKIPVDGPAVLAEALEVDESLLTGEADPVIKQPGDELLSGSFAVAGHGSMIAAKVGPAAHAAVLAAEAQEFTLVRSELRDGINQIIKYLTFLLIPAGLLQIIVQAELAGGVRNGLSRTVAGIVPMVPEGLVLLTSVAFAVGVVRLGRRQCLVQELPAIEGLARVDTVCLDKTGTLTEGGMRLAQVRPPDGSDTFEPEQAGLVAAALSSLGAAEARPNGTMAAVIEAFPVERSVTGSVAGLAEGSVEVSLAGSDLDSGLGSGADPGSGSGAEGAAGGLIPSRGPTTEVTAVWQPTDIAAFSSARKWSGAAFDGQGSWLLGAPDVLATGPAADEAQRLGADGMRILLLARSKLPLDELAADGGPARPGAVEPVALLALEQRIRADAAPTLAYFERQQVTLKVISGDNAVSVGAVAASLGLAGAEHPVDARTLPQEPHELGGVVAENSVFGRVTPRQKQQMVAALQAEGHTVAMTGDGVNDVLALKSADIGVAMGSGSGAARAVAQIVLLDEKFATLPEVVAEGRRVVGNVERVSNLFLVKSFESFLLVVLTGIARLPYPFLPRHTTLVGALTIGTPAFFLALAPNAALARTGFVRRVLRFTVPAGLISGAAAFVSYNLARIEPGAQLRTEQTSAMVTLFTVSLYVLTLVARPFVWWKYVLVGAMGGGFLLVALTPVGRRIFDLQFGTWSQIGTSLLVTACAATALELLWHWAARREAQS